MAEKFRRLMVIGEIICIISLDISLVGLLNNDCIESWRN